MGERTRIVGIGGGTGSGKTTLAGRVAARIPGALHLAMDHYYRPLDHLAPAERAAVNYDHPDAFDVPLLAEHLGRLASGAAVDRPDYDFATHARRPRPVSIGPARVVLVEGILVLAMPELVEHMDLSVYVDLPSDLRILRRLARDVVDRGRTVDSVRAQYLATVRPMHETFVEPSRARADLVLRGDADPERSAAIVVAAIPS